MTDISVGRTSYQVEKLSWLLDRGGFEQESITLDLAAFTAGTHYPNGYVPSGTLIGKITATGLYGPADAAATDGRQAPAGFLATSTPAPKSGARVGAALLFSGVVKESKLPAPATVTTAVKTALAAWFRFV